MCCQGEESICTLLHLVCAGKCYIQSQCLTICVLDELISKNLSALTTPDSSGGRLPIHILLLQQRPSPLKVLIQYFINCSVTQWSSQDDEGNVPLHDAAMYSSSEIFQMILAECPEASTMANYKSRRTPCARLNSKATSIAIDATSTTVSTFHSASASLRSSLNDESNHCNNDTYNDHMNNGKYSDLFTHQDLKHILNICTRTKHSILCLPDTYGRVPLHLLVDHAYPRWDFVQTFRQ